MPSTGWLFDVLVSLAAASSLVLLVASAAVIAMRQPARRIRVIELALGGLAALPLVSLVPGYPRWSVVSDIAWRPSEVVRDAPSTGPARQARANRQPPLAANRPSAAPQAAVSTPGRVSAGSGDYRRWVVGAYLLGAAAMAAWLVLGRIAVRRVLRASCSADARCKSVFRGVAGTAGDRVRLVASPLVSQPNAFGWWRVTIVLPTDFCAAADAQQLRWALAHEWSHVERGDLASWTAGSLLCWLYYWQPLYWYLRRQLYVCQDYLADAAAPGRGEAAEDYAEFLTLSAIRAPRPMLAAGLGFGGRISDLHRRVVMLVARRLPLERTSPRWWNLAAVSMAILLVAAAASLVEGPIASAVAQTKTTDKPRPDRLSYNDGKAEGKRSLGGSGEMISFTLPDEDAKVAGIRIHGSRYGLPQPPKEDFMIYFLNSDMTDTVATKTGPYARFKRGSEGWIEIKFPKPIEVPKEFWICLDFRAERTKGVYVSVDESTDGSHSRAGLPGMESRAADVGGDWMIEALLAK